MTLVMVDLEGTLTDHTVRLRVLQAATQQVIKDRAAWKTYYAGLIDDEPREHVIRVMRHWIMDGLRPLIYSTRFANKYNHEEEWLRGHELWEHVDLIQRLPGLPPQGNGGVQGPDLVCQWVQRFKPTIILDDRVEVRELVRSGYPDVVVMEPDDCIHQS